MADTILQIIQWAIPSGGIGAVIAWFANRSARKADTAKSVHDTYKLMYEDVSRELLETQKKVDGSTKKMDALGEENKRIRYALNRLTRAIQAIQRCPHSSNCPVSDELSLDDEGNATSRAKSKRTDYRQRDAARTDDNRSLDATDKG